MKKIEPLHRIRAQSEDADRMIVLLYRHTADCRNGLFACINTLEGAVASFTASAPTTHSISTWSQTET